MTIGRWMAAAVLAVGLGAGAHSAAAQGAGGGALAPSALFPPAGAREVCPDTPLRLTFAAPPVVGTGKIQIFDAASDAAVDAIDVATATRTQSIGGLDGFKTFPILITGNQAAIYPPSHALAYGKTYYVKVDGGAFKDRAGDVMAGVGDGRAWSFSTKAAGPAAEARRITVAADGTGDFASVQGALDFVPDGNVNAITVFVRRGIYNELVYFANKNNITLLGEDRKQTIIAYSNSDRFNSNAGLRGGYRRGLLRAYHAGDLTIANLTLHNTTAQGGSQAESIILDGTASAHAILANVDLIGFQDTLQINGQAYIGNCYIEGDVDFMWGTGPCFFEDCQARALRNNAYYTQIRNTAANHGYVYKDCTFAGVAGVTGNFLSRIDPGRFPASEVVLLNCAMTDAVGAVAWRLDMQTAAPTVHYWEYNSHDPAGKPVDMSRRFALARQLKLPDDKDTIAQYDDPKWVLGGQWSPALAPIITRQPEAVWAKAGEGASLSVEAAAVPPASYQWQKNGVDIADATGPVLAFKQMGAGDAATYRVLVSNSVGRVTSAPVVLSLAAGGIPQRRVLTGGAGSGARPGSLATAAPAIALVLARPGPQAERESAAPAISAQPAGAAALEGTAPYFFVIASGSGPLAYQWRKDGKPIEGATSATLRLKDVRAVDGGDYTVAVTNGAGVVTSAPATLKVFAPAAKPAPQLPAIPDKIFLITDNGAVADGQTDNAAAIQKTIDLAAAAGGGIVQIPPAAKAYLSGPIVLASKINLQVDAGAMLEPLPYAAGAGTPAYPLRGNAYPNFITARNAHDIALTGSGTIDGNGAAWWAAFNANRNMPHRPFLISLNTCQNVLLSGLTVRNSPMFHAALSACDHLTVFGITMRAPASAANSDGIDPSGAHQLIQQCDVAVGDDNIAVKAGSAFCSDLTIADCTFGTGHGVSIGGQSNRGLDGMMVKNCTFNGTTSGLRMKADPTQGGIVQNCSFTNLTMNNVTYPIVFYSYYRSVGNPGAMGANQTTPAKAQAWNAQPPNALTSRTLPAWKNITIDHLTATGTKGYSIIWGLPLENYFINKVMLHDVRISGGPGFEIYDAGDVQMSGNTDLGKLFTCNALVITKQPEDQSAALGGSASFKITAAGASGMKETGPKYLWMLNGAALADGPGAGGMMVSGATTDTLKLEHISAASGGKYAVMVSIALDSFDLQANALVAGKTTVSATSGSATLTVQGL